MDIELTVAEERCRQEIENFDKETDWHCEDVARRSYDLAIADGFSKENAVQLWRAARIHDIGKIIIPKAIIQKAGITTGLEHDLIDNHTTTLIHHLMPECSGFDVMIAAGHHSREPVVENSIDIVKIADIYSALTMARPYKNPLNPKESLETLKHKMLVNPELLKKYEGILIKNKEIEKTIPSSILKSREEFELRAAKYLSVKYSIDPSELVFVGDRIVVGDNLFATLRDNGAIKDEFKELRVVSSKVDNRIFDQSIDWNKYDSILQQFKITEIKESDITIPRMSQEDMQFDNSLKNGMHVESRYDNLAELVKDVDFIMDEYNPYDIYKESFGENR